MPIPRGRLKELAGLFLKLGATAFGGPAAHIAMMEHEVVRRRGWMTREEFLDLLGATNLLPGPNSTKMSLFVGHARASRSSFPRPRSSSRSRGPTSGSARSPRCRTSSRASSRWSSR